MAAAKTGLDGARLKTLRELKGISQQLLADLVGAPQSRICDLEKGVLRNVELFIRVADQLDCTTDFLFGRGPHGSARRPEDIRDAASRMAFDVFAVGSTVNTDQIERCRRVLGHRAAPVTAESWLDLAEQIELALSSPREGPLRFVGKPQG